MVAETLPSAIVKLKAPDGSAKAAVSKPLCFLIPSKDILGGRSSFGFTQTPSATGRYSVALVYWYKAVVCFQFTLVRSPIGNYLTVVGI